MSLSDAGHRLLPMPGFRDREPIRDNERGDAGERAAASDNDPRSRASTENAAGSGVTVRNRDQNGRRRRHCQSQGHHAIADQCLWRRPRVRPGCRRPGRRFSGTWVAQQRFAKPRDTGVLVMDIPVSAERDDPPRTSRQWPARVQPQRAGDSHPVRRHPTRRARTGRRSAKMQTRARLDSRDRTGIGTVMITRRGVPASLPHQSRVTPPTRRAERPCRRPGLHRDMA